MASRFIRYVQDTRREMAHVSWPTRMQTMGFTAMVIVLSLLVALYLSAFDSIFTQGLKATIEHAPRFIGISEPADVSAGVVDVNGSGTTTLDQLEVRSIPINGDSPESNE